MVIHVSIRKRPLAKLVDFLGSRISVAYIFESLEQERVDHSPQIPVLLAGS